MRPPPAPWAGSWRRGCWRPGCWELRGRLIRLLRRRLRHRARSTQRQEQRWQQGASWRGLRTCPLPRPRRNSRLPLPCHHRQAASCRCCAARSAPARPAWCKGSRLGLGIAEPITSPSFALAHHYRGQRGGAPTALVHLDLYRLEQPAAADELFAQEEEEAQAMGALLAVEWPERLSFVPQPCWCVELELAGEGRLARLWGHTINPTAG